MNALDKRERSIYGEKTPGQIDALVYRKLPIIEVHLSSIYRRDEWRARPAIAPVAEGQISSLAWRGYITALKALAGKLKAEASP